MAPWGVPSPGGYRGRQVVSESVDSREWGLPQGNEHRTIGPKGACPSQRLVLELTAQLFTAAHSRRLGTLFMGLKN